LKEKMKWKKNSLEKLLPKEEEEIGVVQFVGVVLRRPPASSGGAPARWRGFNGGEDVGAPSWLGA